MSFVNESLGWAVVKLSFSVVPFFQLSPIRHILSTADFMYTDAEVYHIFLIY